MDKKELLIPAQGLGRWRSDRGPRKGLPEGSRLGSVPFAQGEAGATPGGAKISAKAGGSTKLFDLSLAPGKELSVFLLAAAAKVQSLEGGILH